MDIDYQKIKEIIELIINDIKDVIDPMLSTPHSLDWYQLIGFVTLNALVSFCAVYLGAYSKRKAVNLASIEDIDKITDKIEGVKKEYREQAAKFSESLKLKNKLKLASIDKRFDMYQEAYTLWLNLMWNLENTQMDKGKIINPLLRKEVEKCQIFWEKKCLFLSQKSRKAFNKAYRLASIYPLKQQNVIDGKPNAERDKKEFRCGIEKLGEQLTKEVGVYFLSSDEYKKLDDTPTLK